MIEQERALVMALCGVPYGKLARAPMDKTEFLSKFRGYADGSILAYDLLQEAAQTMDPDDVEYALIVGDVFGFPPSSLEMLIHLLGQHWHFKHEDLVTAISAFRSPRAVDSLLASTRWVPDYLGYDGGQELSRKATYALGGIHSPESNQALAELIHDPRPLVAEAARMNLADRE